MTAFYNEIDPFAAAWSRELIREGEITEGEVDGRSIAEVEGADVVGYERAHFFAGIGGWDYALRLAGWEPGRVVWTGSCPCQPFSVIGRREGESDERHLWPEFRRLIGECRPPVVFGEQVASRAGREWLSGVRADLEALGYAVGAADLCAASVGSPTRRQRLYWVAQRGGEGLEGFGGDEDGGGQSGRLESGEDRSVAATGAVVPDAFGVDAVSVLRGVDMHDSRGARARLRVSGDRRVGDPALRIWEQYESVPCVDGWRRTQPGIFPLVAGISRGVVRSSDPGGPINANATPEARVGRLRGYGNAIVPQLAATFIRAFLETETP